MNLFPAPAGGLGRAVLMRATRQAKASDVCQRQTASLDHAPPDPEGASMSVWPMT
jgi:hypothetical protein